jgi:hypothetical protein
MFQPADTIRHSGEMDFAYKRGALQRVDLSYAQDGTGQLPIFDGKQSLGEHLK